MQKTCVMLTLIYVAE